MRTFKLGEVCKIVNGGTPRTGTEEYWNGDISWITPKDLGRVRTRETSHTQRKITQNGAENSSAKVIPVNSVILSTRAPIGHVVINSIPMAFNQGCRGLVPSDEITAEFLYYFLKFSKSYLDELGTGTTFRELSTTALSNVEIPLPSIDEQRRIVARLDAAFEKIDWAIELTEKNLIQARSLYISARSRAIKNLSGDKLKFINDIGKNLDSMRVPITKNKRKSGRYPYYGASGIVDYVDDYIFDQDALLISEDGANLLARSTPIAFMASGRYWVNNHAHIYGFSDHTTLKYVEYYLENIDLKPFITGAAQPKLSQGNLNKIPIFIPSIEIQKEIVETIIKAYENSIQLAKLYRKKKSHLESLKQSLLTQAFSQDKVQ